MALGYFGLLSAMVVPVLLQSWARELPDCAGWKRCRSGRGG